MIAGVEVESKKRKKIRGRTGSKDNIAIVPQQRRQKACWHFLTSSPGLLVPGNDAEKPVGYFNNHE
jgi:hypothetical protein